MRDLEFRMRSDVIIGYRRQTNVDPCARKWPSRNLLLYISLWLKVCSVQPALIYKYWSCRPNTENWPLKRTNWHGKGVKLKKSLPLQDLSRWTKSLIRTCSSGTFQQNTGQILPHYSSGYRSYSQYVSPFFILYIFRIYLTISYFWSFLWIVCNYAFPES